MSWTFDLLHTPIEPGITLVEASAGTGKTYCLTGLVLRMLLEEQVSGIDRLLVVTFTNAATDELTTRIREALANASRLLRGEMVTEDPFLLDLAERYGNDRGREVLRLALLNFDELTVATIHGFARRVLEQSAFESGLAFQQEFLEDDTSLLLEMARDTWRRLIYDTSPLVTTVVVQRRLTPSSFLPDHAQWRRHPRTRIEPPSPGLDAAMKDLEEAAEFLRQRFDRLPLQAFLGQLGYLASAKMDRPRIHHLLDDLEKFCQHGDAAGLAAVAVLASSQLADQVLKKHRPEVQQHPVLAACDSLHQAANDLEHALRVTFIHQVEERFAAHKRRAGMLGFDDLLERLHSALHHPQGGAFLARTVGEQYQAALIDEFQDTDLIQYDIFHRLFAQAPLYLIGDPKQAIYRFRGADVFAYMEAKGNAQRIYTLDRNWRSTRAMVQAVGQLFQQAAHPFLFEEIPFEEVAAAGRTDETPLHGDDAPALTWLWLDETKSKAVATPRIHQAVAAEVVRLLESDLRLGDRPLAAGDIAILARTNAQAQGLQEALQRAGVAAVIGRAGDVFDSEEMNELERLLQAVSDPSQGNRLRAALTTRLWGDQAADLEQLAEDDDAWQQRVDRFETYRNLWRQRGFMPMMQQLIDEQGVRSRLLATTDGERRITNLLHAIELLHRAVGERHLSPTGLLLWIANERRQPSHSTDSAELRLESDARAVQICTIHKSKGLEYEVVFCPFLWEGRSFQSKKVLAHLNHREVVYDCGSENFEHHRALAEAEQLAEDLRLIYVALTRARYRTYVVWGQIGRKSEGAASALAWLLAPALGVPELPAGGPAHRRMAEVRSQLEKCWDSWGGQLENFVAQHTELMQFRSLDDTPRKAISPSHLVESDDLACRSLGEEAQLRLKPWQVVSFSSLSQGAAASTVDNTVDSTVASTVASTVDATSAPEGSSSAVPGAPLPWVPPGRELPDHSDPSVSLLSVDDALPEGLFAFAQGPRAGTCLHQILEQCELTTPASEGNQQKIVKILERHGLHLPAAHHGQRSAGPKDFEPLAAVVGMLQRLASSPFPGHLLPGDLTPPPFTLAEVTAAHRKVEWPFFIPLAALVPRDLASLFRKSGSGRVATEYAPRLADLDSRQLQGFLTGFVDQVFIHQGRWYVVDWKSNHLGYRRQNYDDQAMWYAMQHHHYVLQYHLYVLALHLFLEQRQPGYSYEQHFGGVAYLFLRGLGGAPQEAPTTTGWYVDRPPITLVDSLLELVDRRETA